MGRFHDPRARVGTNLESYDLARDVRADEGKGVVVGLLANGFPDSDIFIAKVGEVIGERLPAAELRYWNKGNAGLPANDAILGEIADCDVAIAAYGH